MAIRPLSFIGDHDPPDPLSTVHARRPILGSGKLPKDLVEISKTRSYYVQAKERPSASIESLGKGNERVWWTVEKDNVMAGGSGFTSLAAWGRSNWPLA